MFALALHDLGKFASAFQGLYQPQNSELIIPNSRGAYDGAKFRHDRMGLYFWQDIEKSLFEIIDPTQSILRGDKCKITKSLMVLMNCVLGHHGEPISEKDVKEIASFTEPHNLVAANEFAHDLYALIQPGFPLEKMCDKTWRSRLEQVSWQLAGMADWIGSNRAFFTYKSKPVALSEYWQQAQKHAEAALKATDLHQVPKVAHFESVKHHFGFEPTPLQVWTE